MNLNKDVSSWARVEPGIVLAGSPSQARNVMQMALEDIQRLGRELEAEQSERQKLDQALRAKDEAIGILFTRLAEHRIDCSDLTS